MNLAHAITKEVLNAAEHNISLFPNPARYYFNLEFPEILQDMVQIQIFDLSGKLLLRQNTREQRSQINVSQLSAGTYTVKMDTREVSYYQKLMIVR